MSDHSANDEALRSIEIKELIKIEIAKRGWTIEEAAQHLDVSRGTIYNAYNGKISRKFAPKLAKAFGRTGDYWRQTYGFVQPRDLDVENVSLSPKHIPVTPSNRSGRTGAGYAQILVDHMILDAVVVTKEIQITGFKTENLRPASYDLTVGSAKELDKATGQEKDVDFSKGFQLQPQQAIKITTAETITLPLGYCARVGSIAEHVKKWLSYGIGLQIDPGFSGPLEFTIINWGLTPFDIFPGIQRIISIEIHKLPIQPDHGFGFYDHNPEEIFDELSEQFEGHVESLFSAQPSLDEGKCRVALADDTVERSGSNETDLREECVKEFFERLDRGEAAIQRYANIALDSTTLNMSELIDFCKALNIEYNVATREFQRPDGVEGTLYAPSEDSRKSLSSIITSIKASKANTIRCLIGSMEWKDLLKSTPRYKKT